MMAVSVTRCQFLKHSPDAPIALTFIPSSFHCKNEAFPSSEMILPGSIGSGPCDRSL